MGPAAARGAGQMGEPLVSIIWLNYNSMRIIDLVLESLRGVAELDYDNYELIVVDNGSRDGSFEAIRSFIESTPALRRRTRILRMERNLGFAGGVNAGFRARSPESRYVVLLNNDAIPERGSLRRLVEEMEARPRLGAAQGVIMQLRGDVVDTAGGYLSPYIYGAQLLRGEPPRLHKPLYITYADGAYSIIRVEAALEAMGGERLFYDELFAYCDDNVLGIRLWERGWRVATFPFIAARHNRSSTFGRITESHLYYSSRCISFLYHASRLPLRRRLVARTIYLRKALTVPLAAGKPGLLRLYARAWRDGRRLAERLPPLRLDAAPLLPTRASDVLRMMLAARLLRVDPGRVERLYALED